MSRVWFAADHHFGHEKILQFEKKRQIFASIEEHDAEIVSRHNAVVGKNDVIWFLGDVSFYKDVDKFKQTIRSMNGKVKNLILGNHDQYDLEVYKDVFNSVQSLKIKYKTVMTHVPIHVSSVRRWGMNIHGHTHSEFVPKENGTGGGADIRYFSVSLEQNDLRPTSLDKIREHQKAYFETLLPSHHANNCVS